MDHTGAVGGENLAFTAILCAVSVHYVYGLCSPSMYCVHVLCLCTVTVATQCHGRAILAYLCNLLDVDDVLGVIRVRADDLGATRYLATIRHRKDASPSA